MKFFVRQLLPKQELHQWQVSFWTHDFLQKLKLYMLHTEKPYAVNIFKQ